MADSIKLFPNMPKDEKGQQEIMKMLEARDQQDYQCYLILKEIIDWGHLNPDVPEDNELTERAQEAIDKRVDFNDKFLRLMAGK